MRAAVMVMVMVLAGAVLLVSWRLRPDPLAGAPRVMLWAWERPEDLRFVRPRSAGIAFLARTVRLEPDRAGSKPRLYPLLYAPGSWLMAVVRIESAGGGLPSPDSAIREILPAASIGGVRALQVDFDARASERPWYRDLLNGLVRALPQHMPLTITALASWCEQDGWIAGLPVADAVPMLFRMGPGESLPSGDFGVALCRQSAGIALDELPFTLPHNRRIYFFAPQGWSPQLYQEALEQARRFR